DPREERLSKLPVEHRRANCGPKRVCDDVRHARTSGRNVRLKDLYRKADRGPREDRNEPRAFQVQHGREIRAEKEAKGDKATDVDEEILSVAPSGLVFLPRDFQKRLAQDQIVIRDGEVGRGSCPVMNYASHSFVKQVECNRASIPGNVGPPALRPGFVMLENFRGGKLSIENRQPA